MVSHCTEEIFRHPEKKNQQMSDVLEGTRTLLKGKVPSCFSVSIIFDGSVGLELQNSTNRALPLA